MSEHNERRLRRVVSRLLPVLVLMLAQVIPAPGSVPAGYSLYYIPADEANMRIIFAQSGSGTTILGDPGGVTDSMYSVITITVWADNTRIYIDHWEDGYEIDYDNPDATADEVLPVLNKGDVVTLLSQDVPSLLSERSDPSDPAPVDCDCVPPAVPGQTPVVGCYYDGRDKIYVAGGLVTITRAIMPEQTCNDANGDGDCTVGVDTNVLPAGATLGDNNASTVLATAEEVYPVQPQLTTYILPLGENLAALGYVDFTRVFATIQATENDTVVRIDFDGDGVFDPIDADRDGDCNGANEGATVTLDEGEILLVTNASDGNGGTACGSATALNSRTLILGTETLQVQYFSAYTASLYTANGYSAFPQGFWFHEYYAPADSATAGDTDIFLYNPHGNDITIRYETTTTSGTFTIPANSTISYQGATGAYVPAGSGVHFLSTGGEVFWGISVIDTENAGWDSGYSLVPSYLLDDEYHLGWAPGSVPVGADVDGSGLYLCAAQDFITLFVDYDDDGPRAPVQYNLNRLQSIYLADSTDGDMTGAAIWATGPFAAAYAANPDLVVGGLPGLDLGYTTLPGVVDWVELVLDVVKATDPVVVGTGTGEVTKYTITVSTSNFDVENVRVTDTLAVGWLLCSTGTSPSCAAPLVTFPDGTTSNDLPRIDVYNVIDGRLDINGDGSVTADDDGVFDGIAVIDGYLDMDGDGAITAADDGSEVGALGINVINGGLDTNGSGGIGGADDATGFTGRNLTWDSAVFTGGPVDLAAFQELTIEYYAYTSAGHADGSITRSPVAATGDREVGNPVVTQSFTATDTVFNLYSTSRMSVTKTSDVATAAYPGDTVTYTVTVTNDGATPINNVTLYDVLPDGVTYVTGTAQATGPRVVNVRDEFGTAAYSNNNGSVNWYLDWVESDAAQSPTAGNVRIVTGELRLGAATATNLTCNAYRQVDLSQVPSGSTVTLTLNYRTSGNVDDGEWAYVEVASSPAGPWTTALGFQNDRAASTLTYNIPSGLWSATTTVRVRITGYDGGEYFYVDNVDVAFPLPSATYAADPPPNFIGAGDRYFLNAGQTLTLTFQVTVSDPLATGITEITNTASATCTQIRVPISASVTDPVVSPDQASSMVGDLVWLDSNGNGLHEVGESGIPGVTVTLKDSFGTPIQTTSTDSQGRYLFTNVVPGAGYYVEVNPATLPAGLVQTAPAGRSDNRSNPFDLLTFLGNNRDEFGTAAYTNNNGNVNWASAWTETDSGGGGATGGEILITGGELRINDDTGGANNLIRRSLGVPPGAVAATLSFEYRTANVETDDSIVLEISEDGANFVTLSTYTGTVSGTGTVDISRYLSASTAIRFRVNVGYTGTTDYFFIDNVDVSYYSFSDYLDADIGYAPQTNTAAIGDLVWSDADGDGVRDAGEPGLPGITVQLYSDTNGDGLLDAGDTLVTSTTTGADGSYLFSGVTATGTEDYLVYVDPTQAALTAIYGAGDVDPTTPSLYPVANAASGGLYLNGDFGFTDLTTPSTYSISDRVWFDADADGVVDAGESGLAGVTVALLDASSNIIATTTTGADGTFVFAGVSAGVRYGWRITDQAGVLNDFYGTTAAALADYFQMPGVLTGNTNYSANPNFGYNQTRSIGDQVFNDANGNGVYDAGEDGFGGVEVRLYQDTDNDGVIDAGEPLLATTTSSSTGAYLFSGLTNGNYIVSIPDPPTGYTFTGTDSDGTAAGHQLAATISGGNSDLDADFGYEADTPRSVTGRIWEDLDEDGTINGSEAGLAGVTVTVWLDDGDGIFEPGTGDTLFSTETTDASGNYSFTGLSDEVYFVQPTDQGGVLSGYSPTYEYTEGITAPFNGYERVDLTGGDATGIHFGYRKDVITFVLVASFQAYAEGGRAVLEWDTAAEADSLGFFIERIDPASGERRRLDGALLPALLESRTGGVYRFADESAAPGETWTYELIEVATDGRREVFGPFTVTIGAKGPDAVPEPLVGRFSRSPRALAPVDQARLEVARQRHEQALADRRARSLDGAFKAAPPAGNTAKLAIRETGVYFLSFAEIGRLLNMNPAQTAALADKFRLALTNRGKPVAYSLHGTSGILFYAEAPDGIYASENIYWLSMGKGSAMAVRQQAPLVDPTGAETFKRTVRAETNRYAATTIFTDPETDYWVWDYLIAGTAGQDRKTYPLASPGLAADETAILTVRLVGGSESAADPDHHVLITLNGTVVGEHRWNGTAVQDLGFTVAATCLADGDNTVEVTSLLDAGVPYSVVIVDRFELSYPSFYLADDDRLTFSADDASDSFEEESRRALLAGGFSTPNILVLDITNPKTPAQVRTSPPVELAGGYAVAMRPASHAQYFACTLESLAPVADAYPDQKSSLTSRRNEADYLVITPPELRAAAEALAEYRSDRSLKTMVVDLEDIMDEFNDGIQSPWAIHSFLSFTHRFWDQPPAYVALLGSGTYDYKGYQTHGDNLLPVVMAGTPHGLFASDNRLADIEGFDGLPDLAIGRIPAVTEEEALNYLDKMAAYEASLGAEWRSRMLLLADKPVPGADFGEDSNDLTYVLPESLTVEKIYRPGLTRDMARSRFIGGLNTGAAFANYFGHAGYDRLASDGLLTLSDIDALTNAERPAVMTLMTCLAGVHEMPGFRFLGESLVVAPGGAAAVWSASGLSEHLQSTILAESFYQDDFTASPRTIGALVGAALQRLNVTHPGTFMLDVYTLFGDPALRIE